MSGEGRGSEPIFVGIKAGEDDGTLKEVVIVVSGPRIPNCASCELKEVKSSQLLQQLLLCGVRKEDHRTSSRPPFLCHMLPAVYGHAPRATQPLKKCILVCEKQVQESPARRAYCIPQTVLRAH